MHVGSGEELIASVPVSLGGVTPCSPELAAPDNLSVTLKP